MRKISKEYPVIAWWSGGIASAVTCHLCIEQFGIDNVRVIFIETNNEDDDTYRFKSECEVWYGKEIESISNPNYKNIQEVWYKNLSLNVAGGAVCSSQLKRATRVIFEKNNRYSFQAFGFDIEEIKRAKGLNNNPKAKPIFPLISELMTKDDCVSYIKANNTLFHPLRFPRAYMVGYRNNNCFQTGCVQGGIGYWQKIAEEYPDKLNAMAKIEHDLQCFSDKYLITYFALPTFGGAFF